MLQEYEEIDQHHRNKVKSLKKADLDLEYKTLKCQNINCSSLDDVHLLLQLLSYGFNDLQEG